MQDKERLDRAVLGIVAAVLTIAAIAYVLLVSPAVTAQQTDAYVPAMEALGLTALETGAEPGEYGYLRYDAAAMLTGKYRSMAWAAAAVRMLTQPFGMNFSTQLLAAVYAVLIALGAYLAVSGLARHSHTAAYMVMLTWPLTMLHPAMTGYLCSLYAEGAAIAFSLLFLGCLVHALCRPRGCGIGSALSVMLTGALMLNASAWMMAFAPAVIVGSAICVYHTCARGRGRGLQLMLAGLMAIFAVAGVTTGFEQDQDVHSDAANYLAVFQGILPSAENPEAVLAELGLDASFAPDIGRSYYEAEERFVHNPRGEDAAFLTKLTLDARLRLLLKQPELMSVMLAERTVHIRDAYSTYLTLPDGGMLNGHAGIYLLLETAFGQGGMTVLVNRALFAALASVLLMMTSRRKGGMKLLPLCMLAMAAGMIVYIPLGLAMTGGVDLMRAKSAVQLLSWVMLFYAIVGTLMSAQRVFAWLSERNTRLSLDAEALPVVAADAPWWRRIPVSRGALLMVTTLVWLGMIGALLLPRSHIGGVNNGDFGRMMEQLDLYWLEPQLTDTSSQLGTKVIEGYSYREPFHPERLTSADPTYSLLYPSMLVRLYSLITGEPFSTQLLALVLLLFTLACVLSILRDLYPMLGQLTVLPAALLTLMLLGENYIAWYNSLLGEGSLSTGLLMVLACALHLAVMPRSGKGCIRWLVLLALSLRFLCCSKAQMALALPVGLILLVVLAVYHRPKGAVRCSALALLIVLLGGWTTWHTLGVYQKNDGVSQKQTVWQSVFYGALMIADDPEATMTELGIPLEMKADIGKHAYYADGDYVYAPLSKEAEEKFYSKVNTFTMVGYYLRHPKDLLTMLDRAAQESVELHTGFMAYTDELYAESAGPYRLTLWANLRTLTAGRAFWHYVLGYGVIVVGCVWLLFRRKTTAKARLLILLLLALLCIGVLQYPLTVIGNGFADNNKQLYAFMLCHDLLIVALLTAGVKRFGGDEVQLGT